MHNCNCPAETFLGHDPAHGQTVVAPFVEAPNLNRRFQDNLKRVRDALRAAGAESASVHFTGWGCTLQFQRVRFTPADTDGESRKVRLDIESHDHSGPGPHPRVDLQAMSLNKALEVLAVAHGERSGMLWNEAAPVRTSVQFNAVDDGVGMTLRTTWRPPAATRPYAKARRPTGITPGAGP